MGGRGSSSGRSRTYSVSGDWSRPTYDDDVPTTEARKVLSRIMDASVGTEITSFRQEEKYNHISHEYEPTGKEISVTYRVTGTPGNKVLREVKRSKEYGEYSEIPNSPISLRRINAGEYNQLMRDIGERLSYGDQVRIKRTALSPTERARMNEYARANRRQLRLF